VLVEGDDLDEPIADEVRGLLDGHVVLSRQLAQRGHYPAIDLVASLSRLLPVLAEAEQRSAAEQLRQHLARYEDKRELITLGAYEAGNDPALDDTLARIDDMYAFLRQPQDEASDLRDTLRALRGLLQ
jgi:flagellar biosynthesis/type III secretory pathway ATPase